MDERGILMELGLSDGEARLYLALLGRGPSRAGELIRDTGFHRGTAYQLLDRLKEKGLVSSVVREGKQHFEAANPRRLMDLLKKREEYLSSAMPGLEAKMLLHREEQEVTVYTGVNGIRTVLDRMMDDLRKGGTYYDFGVSGLFRTVMGSYWDLWQKRKKRYGLKSFVIFNRKLLKTEPDLLKNYSGEARFHPPEYSSLTDTMIYGDTVVLFIWTAKPLLAVVIKSRANAKSYLNQFKLLWKHASRG
ncbi:MAG: helix-turn-helix domain-containing protein [Candidatus Micrarchaeota archaeon]